MLEKRRLARLGDETQCACSSQRLTTTIYAEFPVDVQDVSFRCVGGDVKAAGDFGVTSAESKLTEHFELTSAQRRNMRMVR